MPENDAAASTPAGASSKPSEVIYCGVGLIKASDYTASGVVVAPYSADTPSAQEGIRSGEILKRALINGEWKSITSDEEFLSLRGPRGTPLTLEIENRAGQTRQVTMLRDFIHSPSLVPSYDNIDGQSCGMMISEAPVTQGHGLPDGLLNLNHSKPTGRG